jgi:hypothetical protein
MDVDLDAIIINALSTEERERHVKEGLCFICHKAGHQSRACPMRKNQNRNNYKGKTRGNAKGKRRPFTGRHIRQTSAEEREDGDDPDGYEGVEEDQRMTTIRALMQGLSTNERLNLLADLDEQDF